MNFVRSPLAAAVLLSAILIAGTAFVQTAYAEFGDFLVLNGVSEGDTIRDTDYDITANWDIESQTCAYAYDTPGDPNSSDGWNHIACTNGGLINPPDSDGEHTLYVAEWPTSDFSGFSATVNVTFTYETTVLGCTDPGANNYDPSANQNDDSCTYDIPGCMDPSADNYDSTATVDDGSCLYPEGCTDSSANNFDPFAVVDDGSCTYDVPGCMDSSANNYDPDATVDDGSCTYDPPDVPGCTDPAAENYDPDATVDDASCVYNTPPSVGWNNEPAQADAADTSLYIDVYINDAESDTSSLSIRYSLDGGTTWHDADHLSGTSFPISGNTVSGITTYGSGGNNRSNLRFFWNFNQELGMTSSADAEVEVTPHDDSGDGTPLVSDPFTLTPPAPAFAEDSGAVTDITENSVTVHYDTSTAGSASLTHFELDYADDAYYLSHDSSYAQNTPITFSASLSPSGATDVTGLTCGTTYHFIQALTNGNNLTATSSDATFTTSDCTNDAPPFPAGNGSSGAPWVIDDCSEIPAINDFLSDYFILADDLDCTELGNDVMIGGIFSDSFSGVFDGNGKSITIDIDDPGEPAVGLFRTISGGYVHDLTIADGSQVTGLDLVGSVAGIAADSTFTRVSSHATVTATAPDSSNYPFTGTGGLMGGLYGGAVYGSSYDSVASSPFIVGGIAGFVGNDLEDGDGALISRSSTDAHVHGQFGVGGIAGYMEHHAQIRNSYAEGTVVYSADFDPPAPAVGGFGGIVGLMADGVISRSYSRGLVSNTSDEGGPGTGGLVGAVEIADETTIVHSFAAAQIDATDAGALIGSFNGGEGDMFSGMLDNYYDTSTTGLFGCVAGDEGSRPQCSGVDGSASGYWLHTTGTPLAAWNAADVWDFSGEDSAFPTLIPYFGAEPEESDDPTPTPPTSNGVSPIETILDTNHYHGGGVAQGWHDDDNHWEYDLPFNFTFYGQTYDKVYVDSNGYLAFSDSGSIDAYSVSVADGIGVPTIFAYGNDLLTDANDGDDIYVTDNNDGQVIFRWQATDIDNHDSIANFEIALKNDNTFEINYGPQTEPINDVTAVGVSDGAGTYATSTYDGRTDFNELNTSSWAPPDESAPPAAPTPTHHHVRSGSSVSSSFFSAPSSSSAATTLADLQAKFAALEALYQKIATPAAAPAGGLPARDVTVGATGSDVTALQQFLITQGYPIPAGATGYFGAQTRAALAAYQKAHGITPAAGYFGPVTRATMHP